jgi:YVTN family beta-propeller protein
LFQTDTIEVGESPNALAASPEAIWVANGGGTVSRIDPVKREVVKTIDVGNAPAGIAVGLGNVWVSVQSP